MKNLKNKLKSKYEEGVKLANRVIYLENSIKKTLNAKEVDKEVYKVQLKYFLTLIRSWKKALKDYKVTAKKLWRETSEEQSKTELPEDSGTQ